MARSFSNAKVFSVFFADGISTAVFRRGYATGSQGVVSSAGRAGASRNSAVLNKTGEESARSTEKVSWVPDPKTGYYRPDNGTKEIDPAELRATLLNNKH
ncbi:protein SENESCENCE-ASSOCIATED GENE 21, mitochondrial-like [Carica papaya]|uniref:protein SENESCENCE-ASSOCIATED GENE 21, mitochondrial-like n=1 Tax=Carica papaya TaxID=3649 RepID=UPI000B8CFC92|nr:protein SENESCENCE-ASSOCIATED GENE 21, mitochondrial-like [Carica papaya]